MKQKKKEHGIFKFPFYLGINYLCWGFPGGSKVKASASNAGDPGSIPGLGRSPGGGNGNPLHYSCLENPMDRGAWWAAVHGVIKSRARLSEFTFIFTVRVKVLSLFFVFVFMYYLYVKYYEPQFSSVTQSFPTLCNPMNHSTPGLPVYHQLPEATQTHVH